YLIVEPEEETAKRLRDKVQKGFYFDVREIHRQYEMKHPEDSDEDEEAVVEDDPDNVPAEEDDPDDIPAEEEDPDDIPAE
ncbi:MAG: hypothetical protein K2O47_02305, partial [Muribaculaceae bacterium]|nr:hypothetical protein [Muribaculaceae bacterium]